MESEFKRRRESMKKIIVLFNILFFCSSINAQSIQKLKSTGLDSIIAASNTPLIVNFWATFCKPCVAEIPHFQKIAGDNNVRLLLVSIDLEDEYPEGIAAFAKKRKFTAPIAWLNETNADYFCPRIDSSWSGAIPASLFINNKTGYRKFIGDEISAAIFSREIEAMLKQ
jgi:thiol-disulfide isomerase/thioredoxin